MKPRQVVGVYFFDPFVWVVKRVDPGMEKHCVLRFVVRNAYIIALRLHDTENRFRMVLRRSGLTVRLRHPPTPPASRASSGRAG
ncbi:MAG: hypothetical protein KGJ23_08620 [Euryarchaeota archaeon]|nr:hypothetical protein [Euryarchaeota archaeon]MDE1836666.1 hypothetical protein [Euryarchaeota archaeon]MDE1880305.1 hypothetical protein [Euryarchaeota archaeon]MDE2044636.1 hypothetical protein [Thermoplasmata archaeon]